MRGFVKVSDVRGYVFSEDQKTGIQKDWKPRESPMIGCSCLCVLVILNSVSGPFKTAWLLIKLRCKENKSTAVADKFFFFLVVSH